MDCLEKYGYVVEEYVSRLLSDVKDDLFENVGVEYEEIVTVMVKVLEAALEEAKAVAAKSNQED